MNPKDTGMDKIGMPVTISGVFAANMNGRIVVRINRNVLVYQHSTDSIELVFRDLDILEFKELRNKDND
jgi:hypothetical protein